MAKKGANSWFTVVKKAFRSPTKKRVETEQEDQDKKREKPRWIFRKATQDSTQQHKQMNKDPITDANRRSSFVRERYTAAVVIQTAFRGYLGRRALGALKGIVRLQAFIRGQNTRKQARETLRCMEALIRVQQQSSRKSMFAETNNLWDRYMQDIRQRKSTSAKERGSTDHWGGFPSIFEGNESMLQLKEAYALSKQIRRSGSARTLRADEEDMEERTDWLNQWMEKKQWEEYTNRGSIDRREAIKTVQMDTSATPHHQRSPYKDVVATTTTRHSLSHPTSFQARPASPRSVREVRSHSTANTPSLKSKYCYNKGGSSSCGPTATTPRYMATTESAKAKVRSASTPRQRPSTPSRERGGSARKRLSYPIHEYGNGNGSVCTDNSSFSHSLRSPSFRSVCPAIERGAYHSYYAESGCGEVSPASTTQIRRWLN